MLLIIIVTIIIITTDMTTEAQQSAIQKPLFSFPKFYQSRNTSVRFQFVAAAVHNSGRFLHAAIPNTTHTNCYKTNLYSYKLLPPPVEQRPWGERKRFLFETLFQNPFLRVLMCTTESRRRLGLLGRETNQMKNMILNFVTKHPHFCAFKKIQKKAR